MEIKINIMALDKLTPYVNNARKHPESQIKQIMASMREFGFTVPILESKGFIVAGHGRYEAAKLLYEQEAIIKLTDGRELPKGTVPVIDCSKWSKAQVKAYTLADNRLAETSSWDDDLLKLELKELDNLDFDYSFLDFDFPEMAALSSTLDEPHIGSLSECFGIPPFSVFNAREGWWQNRKKEWLSFGIQSEVGRGLEADGTNTGGLLYKTFSSSDPSYYNKKLKAEKKIGKKLSNKEFLESYYSSPNDAISSGTSIFDPVLCELLYRWFSPERGLILDPFAGGSVRGIVASRLKRNYYGIDLRKEQIVANKQQAASICDKNVPKWIEGDSLNIHDLVKGITADFLFSCPPYADLEVYSDNPSDLSTMSYENFKVAYYEIIHKSSELLNNDSFACFVVGEVRDKNGNYIGLVPDTIDAFTQAGLKLYNEAILITQIGSLPIRVKRMFETSRKLGKTHQNVLIFIKGSAKAASEKIGKIEFGNEDIFQE